jgi:diguanylate cyclase (GGDEF)-like protein
MRRRLFWIGWKPFAALAAGAASLILLIYFYMAQRQFEDNYKEVRGSFQTIDRSYYRLSYEILRSSLFAYSNQDKIAGEIAALKEEYERLRTNVFLKRETYQKTERNVAAFGEALNDYEASIDDFMMLNAGIKNSFVFITSLSAEKIQLFENDPQTYARILSIIAEVSHARILSDAAFLRDLKSKVAPLGRLSSLSREQETLLRSFILHVHFIAENYPGLVKNVRRVEDSKLDRRISVMEKAFLKESKSDFVMLDRFVVVLLILFLTALVLVVGLLIRTAHENRRLRQLDEELRHSLSHDHLTGLLSRSRFEAMMETFERPVLLLLNVDSFKHINDFYGIAAGNTILKKIARLIRQTDLAPYRPHYFRLGGDEFGVVLQNIDTEQARQLGNLLKKSIERHTFTYEEIEVYLTVSVAVNDVEPLLENADLMLKYEKMRHSDGVALFSETLHLKERAERNIAMTHEVKKALDRDAIVPWFQPIVDLQSGEVVKYEALVRLEREDGTVSGPETFLTAAMQTSYYRHITAVMLQKVFEAMQSHGARFSLNLGMRDLADEKMVSMLLSHLEIHKEHAGCLEIELLESEELDDLEAVHAFIEKVKRYGCRVAIDDFGVGYSNFSFVMELDIDVLKIDGSLIMKMVQDKKTYRTVKTIVRFAQQLGLDVVAEYVENEATARALQEMGVGYAQGYYYGYPSPLIEAAQPDLRRIT